MTTAQLAPPTADNGHPLDQDLCRMADGGLLELRPAWLADDIRVHTPADVGPPATPARLKRRGLAQSFGLPDAAEASRREAFAALVAVQDRGRPVGRSREDVARRFHLTLAEVTAVEKEGLNRQWPPLGEAGA